MKFPDKNEWIVANASLGVDMPPKGIVIKAYAYYDPKGTEYVGTFDEIKSKLYNRSQTYEPVDLYERYSLRYRERKVFIFVWKLTGIGKEALNDSRVH